MLIDFFFLSLHFFFNSSKPFYCCISFFIQALEHGNDLIICIRLLSPEFIKFFFSDRLLKALAMLNNGKGEFVKPFIYCIKPFIVFLKFLDNLVVRHSKDSIPLLKKRVKNAVCE